MLDQGKHREPKPEDICYYKSFKSSRPDKEYDERCLNCDGYPDEGCMKYTTREHVESFYSKYGFVNIDKPVLYPTGMDCLEEGGGAIPIEPAEPVKRLDDVGGWRGRGPGFGVKKLVQELDYPTHSNLLFSVVQKVLF